MIFVLFYRDSSTNAALKTASIAGLARCPQIESRYGPNVYSGHSTHGVIMPVSESETGARQVLSALATGVFVFLLTAAAMHAAIRNPLCLHADYRSEKLEMLRE